MLPLDRLIHKTKIFTTMKKLLSFVAALTIVCTMSLVTSCGNSDKSSEKSSADSTAAMVEKYTGDLKEHLPINVGDGLTLTDIYIADGYFTEVFEFDGSLDTIEDTPEARAAACQAIKSQFLDLFKSDNLGIRYIYKQKGTDKEKSITIPVSEL